ncbi:P22AR C-terminal domain-containing protein [Serratia fonticola]
MNIVQNNQLTFHNTTFAHMEIGGQIWLTASEIGQALEYADDKAIHRLFRKHADEFTNNMTGVVKVTTPGGMQDVRMFSLRGSHLIGMFARTPKAKEFRRWVLDILDREVAHSPIAKQFTDEELINLSYMWIWMDKGQRVSKAIYPAMKQIGSTFSGYFYDMGHETRYMTEKAREALIRETANIDKNGIHARHAAPMLDKLNGKKELH